MADSIFTFKNLYLAYLDCRKNKRNSLSALEFEFDLERNLNDLLKELKERVYKPGPSICFVVKEPCIREVFAASFRDRVVHHLLVREVEEAGERAFIHDSYACRKGKGTHKAVERLTSLMRKVTSNYTKKGFYLKMDISGFFMSIGRKKLYSLFEKLVLKEEKEERWKKEVLWLGRVIIFHNPTKNYVMKGDPSLFSLIPARKSLFRAGEGKGLPIGNYSSQFFANLYLNELDQFVKRRLKIKHYLRYVDDFVIIGRNRESLKKITLPIKEFLKRKLLLSLNFSKTKLEELGKGISFLGYFLKPDCILVEKRVVKRFKKKIGSLKPAVLVSYRAHFEKDRSFNLFSGFNLCPI